MSRPEVAAIILAAGESTRMGRPKQLLPWDGRTLIEWQIEQMLEAQVEDVIVVLGHEASTIGAAVEGMRARIVVNSRYEEGRASSVRCGAEALGPDAEAIVILSVDQPRPAWVTRRLIERWKETQAAIVTPTINGRHGHPTLLDASLRPELQTVTEAGLGLREITDRYASRTEPVSIANANLVFDLNTPSEYDAALGSFRSGAWAESS